MKHLLLSEKAIHALARSLGHDPMIWTEDDLVHLIELTLERKGRKINFDPHRIVRTILKIVK